MRVGTAPRSRPRRRIPAGWMAVVAALVLLPLLTGEASAQFFGQNKVQYKQFRWKVLRTQHFDVHYYQGTEAAVNDAALMAERAYLRLSRVLNHQIRARIPLVLYASHTDFEQTNITPEIIGIGTGGVTEFLKRRVFLPFTGSYAELDHVLTHELVHAFQVDVLFGESQGLLGNPFAAQIPLWFMEGMAEYLSVGTTDPNTAMWLRDASLEGYLIPISTLAYVGDIRVYRFGQSIFQYIAETYGVAKVGELLKKTRRFGNAERALEATTGLTVNVLSKKWTESVRKSYLPQIVDHQSPTAIATKLTDSERDYSNFNVAPAVSPSGLQFVFISDRSRYNDVYLASALDGKIFEKLIEGERTGSFETLRFFNTAIAWSPDEKLIAIPAKVGGEDALYVIEVPSGKILKKFRFGLDAIYSPSWSPDGSKFTFVGLKQGRSFLYIGDAKGKKTSTRDLRTVLSGRYAVRDPVWSPDGTQIAYSTDQGEGTDVNRLIFGPLRLAVLDVATGKVTVPPGQQGKNISPQWSPDGRSLLFVSDRSGIPNIHRMDLVTGESVRLTDLLTGISGLVAESPCLSVSRDGNRILFTAFHRGGWDVYAVREPEKFLHSPPAIEKARTLATTPLGPLGTEVQAAAGSLESSVPDQELEPAPAAEGDSARALPEAEIGPSTGPATPDSARAVIDTTLSDYVQEVYATPLADSTTFQHLPYRATFTRDYFTGGAVVASNVGFAGSSVISFSDLLGNHNILAILNLYGNLGESDVYLAYTNLSRRTNYGFAVFQYQKDLLLFSSPSTDDLENQIHRGGSIFFARPFNRFHRIEYGMTAAVVDKRIFRYDYERGVVFETSDPGNYFYFGPNIGYVRDNALFGSTGPVSGGRSRVSVEAAMGGINYTTGIFDWRNYSPLGRRFTMAQRLIGGGSFGKDPQFFRLGGAFTYRGVDYGDLIGTRTVIGNLEFRFPLIETLRVGFPLTLSLGGVQGVLFLDAASAWNGDANPVFFSNEGGFHPSGAHIAYGFGARINLGYFIVRYDYGREHRGEHGIGDAHHFLTFGPDF